MSAGNPGRKVYVYAVFSSLISIQKESLWVHAFRVVRQQSVLRRVLGRVLGKGSQKGSEKGEPSSMGFARKKGSEKGSQKGF